MAASNPTVWWHFQEDGKATGKPSRRLSTGSVLRPLSLLKTEQTQSLTTWMPTSGVQAMSLDAATIHGHQRWPGLHYGQVRLPQPEGVRLRMEPRPASAIGGISVLCPEATNLPRLEVWPDSLAMQLFGSATAIGFNPASVVRHAKRGILGAHFGPGKGGSNCAPILGPLASHVGSIFSLQTVRNFAGAPMFQGDPARCEKSAHRPVPP